MNLAKYRSTALGKRLPSYARSARKRLAPMNLSEMSDAELWAVHESPQIGKGGPSLLDVKSELAERMLRGCVLCERRCGADRLSGQTGFCGVAGDSFYFFEQILWGEEPPLIPSHEIFFSGCNLRCKFCYAWESVLDTKRGVPVKPEALAALISDRRMEGAANLNLIGGEPTVHLPNILKALKLVESPTPVVWNSNFAMAEETMRLLNGVVDLYVGDFRFGNDRCGAEIGGFDRYFDTAARNFRMAAESGELIIRHLLLPGHVECCLRPIAKWTAENLPGAPFNLMFQYTPFFKALEDPKLCRSITPEEEAEATRIVDSFGLNTHRWKRPLKLGTSPAGSGPISTTITIRPDGQVGFMHLSGDMREIAEILAGK